MKGQAVYRNETVAVLEAIHNRFLNRIDYLIRYRDREIWTTADCLGPITWIIGA